MRTLILSRNSLSVGLEGEHLVVRDHANEAAGAQRVPLAEVERVIVCGQPSVTFPVMAKLLDMGIPCGFLTRGGRWRGVMDGDPGFHAGRRKRQYESMADEDFRLRLASRVILAKLKNSRRTLQRLAANRGMKLSDNTDYQALERCISVVPFMRTVDAVRGLEGVAAADYFRLLLRFFPKDIPFICRTRRPPRDAANALLSFLYTLLTNEVVAAVRSHGLDVAAGYFHRECDRSPALALDLMEPFRPVLADRVALDLLNHGRLDSALDFEKLENGGVHLTDRGRPVVFRAFDEALVRKSETGHGALSMRQLIDRDVCSFIRMLENAEQPSFYQAA